MNMSNKWFLVAHMSGEFIATLNERGALTLGGSLVEPPFTVWRPANSEEADWAEAEIQRQVDAGEAIREADA